MNGSETTTQTPIPLFGRLALEAGMVSMGQLRECLAEQFAEHAAGLNPPPLGKVLAIRGYMTLAQVEEILRLQQARSKAEAHVGSEPIREVTFDAGEVIFRQDDPGACDLLVLLAGAAEVGRDGRVLATVREKGAFLGEAGAILNAGRMVEVKAVEPCRALRIPAAHVSTLLADKPAMALRLIESLAERFADAICVAPTAETPEPCPPRADPSPADAPADGGVLSLNSLATLAADDSGDLALRDIRQPDQTFINGEPVDEGRPVGDEDIIQVGAHVVQVFLNHPHRIEIQTPTAAPADREVDEPHEAIEAPSAPEPTATMPAGGADAETLAACVDAMTVTPLSDDALATIETRLQLQVDLAGLADARDAFDPSDEHADDVAREFSRQRRELKKPPARATLAKSLAKVEAQLAAPDDGSAETTPADMKHALQFGLRQKQLLLARADATAATLSACAAAAADEPLYAVFCKLGVAADKLFGWGVYGVALNDLAVEGRARTDEIRSLLTGDPAPDAADVKALSAERIALDTRLTAIRREQTSIERERVAEFWAVYEAAAVALVDGVAAADEPFVRAFLRRGLLGCSPRFINAEAAKALLTQCGAAMTELSAKADATHVLYADESIVMAATGAIPNAHDEDLELKQANTPRWKADRSWRRGVNYRIQEAILRDVMATLNGAADAARREQDATEKRLAMLKRTEPDFKVRRAKMREAVHALKVEAVRKERLAEIVNDQTLHRLGEKAAATAKMLASVDPISAADRARSETAFIRQQSRLAAGLSEPFLPFALCENVKSAGGEMIDRDVLAEDLHEAERLDPLLFSDSLVPGAKKIHRVLVRTGPIAVILPAGGSVSMTTTPRCDGENGSFVVPGFFARKGDRRRALWNALSDYRYDTSKAASGVDAMTSDTLVAAYAEFRWSVRKKNRDARQKVGVYTEENDRVNWRRHYEMYMKSADDSGKQLFFKSADLYQLIVGKFIDLPEGGEILKKG